MSCKASVVFPPQVFLKAPQTSTLPFLYQTRTLLSGLQAGRHRPVYKCTDKLRCRSTHTAAIRVSYKPLEPVSNLECQDGNEPNSFSPRWSAASSRDAPSRPKSIQWPSDTEGKFRDLQRPNKPDQAPVNTQQPSQFEEGQARSSTITASEKAVFDRIFNDISTAASEKDEARHREGDEQEYLDLDTIGEEDVWDDPREQLNSIFNLAISKKKELERLTFQDKDKATADVIERSYKRAISHLSSDDLGRATFERKESAKQPQLEQPLPVFDDEVEASFERASNDHRTFVDSMLNAANTDVEIWAVLVKEVFDLMTQLNTQTKLEDKARRADLRRQKKAAKLALYNQQDKDKPAESPASAPPPASKKTIRPGTSELDSEALPTSALLSLLQSNYAHHCLHALRLFRNLRLSSPYAFHLLSYIKSLGPVSYVLGASTELYNEILFQKWMQFSDVQGMADLMEEMINQGISADVTTLEFLRFVDRSRRLDLQGQHGSAKRTWWGLRPIREGWTRVRALYQRFMDEMGEAGEWDRERMRLDRRALLRGTAVEHEWVKAQRGEKKKEKKESYDESITDEPRLFRKLVLDAPLLKRISSDWKDGKPVKAAHSRSPTRRSTLAKPRLPYVRIMRKEDESLAEPKVKLGESSTTLSSWE